MSLHRWGFSILSDVYSGNKVRMKFKCDEGHVFFMSWDNFYSGNGCCYCNGNYKKTHADFCNDIKNKYGDEYLVVGEYVSSNEKIDIKHVKCGNVYKVRPYSILGGRGCNHCFGNKLKSTYTFKKEVRDLVGNEYFVIGDYINSKTKIEMRHSLCGHVYKIEPQSFLWGTRCARCKSSKGEKVIDTYLTEKSIRFKREYKFDDCVYRNPLRFDFAIFDDDYNLKTVIEYDGIQHYKPIDVFGGDDGYKETIIRDNIKNKYCEDNGISLFRIPYYEIKKIEEMLDDIMSTI